MANLDCQLGGIRTHPGDTAVVVSVRALQRGLTEGRRASQRGQRLLAGGLSIKMLEEKAVCLPSLLPAELGRLSQRLWFFLDTSPCFFCLLCGLHTCSSLEILLLLLGTSILLLLLGTSHTDDEHIYTQANTHIQKNNNKKQNKKANISQPTNK